MGDATVNGDLPQSAIFSHLNGYPIVSDSVKAFQENSYGRKSIDLTNAAYGKFVKPTFPYLQTPAAYAKPYVVKADELGDKLLTKVDERVPIVKSETEDIKKTVITYVHWPIEQAGKTKEWVFSTYNDQYKQCGGDGPVAGGKAVITSSLILTSDALSWLSSFLAAKKQEAKEVAVEAKEKATE